MMDICPDMSRVGSPQICIRKDTDTSDTSALMVMSRNLDFFVAPNWFLYTDAANDDTRVFMYPCGIPYSSLFLMPVCVSNVHRCSQLPD